MTGSEVKESPAMFAAAYVKLLTQSRQRGFGQRRVAAATLVLENADHDISVLGLEPVVHREDVLRDFVPQRPGLFA
jgi:hypothetical protein